MPQVFIPDARPSDFEQYVDYVFESNGRIYDGDGNYVANADGNEYIDFLCAYGPVVLGHRHPEVEEAADRQRRDGDCFNHPGAVMVDLAEKLVDMIDFADWVVFGKNGSDMTTWAIQVAREHTRRWNSRDGLSESQ